MCLSPSIKRTEQREKVAPPGEYQGAERGKQRGCSIGDGSSLDLSRGGRRGLSGVWSDAQCRAQAFFDSAFGVEFGGQVGSADAIDAQAGLLERLL